MLTVLGLGKVTGKFIKISVAVLIPLLVLAMPQDFFPIVGISVVEKRMLAIFFMATILWILEPVPVFATSVLVVFAELLLVSTQCLGVLKETEGQVGFGTLISYKEVMAVFASPIILLFIGGFFLAGASKKYRLDVHLTSLFLAPFGKNPSRVILGIMILTALFSMFMSNTATTAMMLSMVMPLLVHFEGNETGKVALILSVPFAANVGGLGTPIGSPPNAVALKYLIGDNSVSFGSWMMFGIPYVVVMVLFAWFILLKLYPVTIKEIILHTPKKTGQKNWRSVTVYVVFGLTVLLWITDRVHGINSYVVAMLPVTVFSLSGIITEEDLKKISWDVLWLVAGGLALGLGMGKTGLSQSIVDSISFNSLSGVSVLGLVTLLTVFMATFMSNTATANLILPIVFVLGSNTASLVELGGPKMIVLATTFACSLAMSLPVSTPPNAIAYASGAVRSDQMIKGGIIIGGVGLFFLYCMLALLKSVHFL